MDDFRKTMKRAAVALALFFGVVVASEPAHAVNSGENFIVTMIKGFKLGNHQNTNKVLLNEYIPEGETVQNWTKMITVLIFLGRKDIEVKNYLGLMTQGFASACQKMATGKPALENIRGYEAGTIILACTREKKTGKGSLTLVRVYKGNDSFYVIQRAWRGAPFQSTELLVSKDEINSWVAHFNRIYVCDTRSAKHACLKPKT